MRRRSGWGRMEGFVIWGFSQIYDDDGDGVDDDPFEKMEGKLHW